MITPGRSGGRRLCQVHDGERGLGCDEVLDADPDKSGDRDGIGVAPVGADLADLDEVAFGERSGL